MAEQLQSQDITTGKVPKEYIIETIDEKSSDYLVDYEYGQIKDKLTPGIEVKKEVIIPYTHTHTGGSDGEQIDYSDILNTPGSVLNYYQEYNSSFSSGIIAGSHTITCGFRPKRIDIYATATSGYAGNSEGTMIINTSGSIVQGCKYIDGAYTQFSQIGSSQILIIKNTGASTYGQITAISDTGFTLTINNNNWNFYCLITVQG